MFFVLMFTVYLFGLLGHSYENIMEIKYILFLLICGGYCLIMAFLCFQRSVLFPGQRLSREAGETFSGPLFRLERLFFFFVILYMCFTILSALLSEYGIAVTLAGTERKEGALCIAIYCLVGIFTARFYRPALWHHYLFSLALLLFCAVAILQFFGWNPLELYPEGYNYYDKYVHYGGAFLSTMGNVGLVSAFLSIAVPFSAVCSAGLWRMRRLEEDEICEMKGDSAENEVALKSAEMEKKGKLFGWLRSVSYEKKIAAAALLSAAAAFCGAAVLLYSGVLAGILGVIGSAALFLPAVAGFDRKKTAAWFIVLSFSAAAFISFVYCNDGLSLPVREPAEEQSSSEETYRAGGEDSLRQKDETSYPRALCELHELLHGNFDDSFGTGRIHIYRNVLHLVPEHLYFGGGPDTLCLRDTEDFRRYDTKRKLWIETHIDSAHSEYLNILVNQGLFALAAYLGIIVCAALFLLKSRSAKKRWNENGFRLACGAAAVSWLIQALFGISMYISEPYFWMILGMLFYLPSRDASRRF